METIKKDLECVEVAYTSDKKKATLTFFDEERGEIREVNYNLQSYENGKWKDDAEKKEKIEKMIQEELNLTFDTLNEAVGMKKDVYCYSTFSSLHKVDQIQKFTKEQMGEIYQTTIKEIIDDTYAIKIRYEIDGDTYESKMTHGKYLETRKQWATDNVKKEKQYAKFEEKFLVPVTQSSTLIGKPIMVECKCAFGNSYYGDIKKFPRKK